MDIHKNKVSPEKGGDKQKNNDRLRADGGCREAAGEYVPYVPTLHYKLPHRQAGVFGATAFGRVAEWVTTTWPRFNIFVCWIFIVALLLAIPDHPAGQSKLEMLLISPLAAPFLYVAVVLLGWVAYVTPVLNFVAGSARMFYLWLFCRLIAQPAPHLAFPAWLSERSL